MTAMAGETWPTEDAQMAAMTDRIAMAARVAGLGLALAFAPVYAQAGETVDYVIGGETFEGYRAAASGASKGLVLVIHDWDGLTDYEQRRADMIAGLGYDAFAVDLFGKGTGPPTSRRARRRLAGSIRDRQRMRALILGGLAEARKGGAAKTVVMGYCFGGTAALELARSGKADGVVGYTSFHGGLETPKGQAYPPGTAPILIAHGGADTSVTMEHLAALAKESRGR